MLHKILKKKTKHNIIQINIIFTLFIPFLHLAGISSINSSLLSVSGDLSTQEIQVNCYTFRVEPDQVTWSINTVLITPDSSYHPVNYSELLNSAEKIYRNSITLTGLFTNGTNISCSVSINGEISSNVHVLQGKLSLEIFVVIVLYNFFFVVHHSCFFSSHWSISYHTVCL